MSLAGLHNGPMPTVLVRSLVAVAGANAAALAMSSVLLDGPDPTGWWNFLPALVWYATLPVLAALAVAAVGLVFARLLRRNSKAS